MKSVCIQRVENIIHIVKDLESVFDNMSIYWGTVRPEIIKGRAESRGKTDRKFFTAYEGGRYGYWDTTSQIGFPLGLQESNDYK